MTPDHYLAGIAPFMKVVYDGDKSVAGLDKVIVATSGVDHAIGRIAWAFEGDGG